MSNEESRFQYADAEPVNSIEFGLSLTRKNTIILRLNDSCFSLDEYSIVSLSEGFSATLKMMADGKRVIEMIMTEAKKEIES